MNYMNGNVYILIQISPISQQLGIDSSNSLVHNMLYDITWTNADPFRICMFVLSGLKSHIYYISYVYMINLYGKFKTANTNSIIQLPQW